MHTAATSAYVRETATSGSLPSLTTRPRWLVYQQDEEHRRVIEQLIVPVTAERLAVQLRHP